MDYTTITQQLGSVQTFFAQHPFFFALFIAWTLYWKGMGLWKAAKLEHQKWFIAMLILNTVGILEILYIYIFSKKLENKKSATPSV